MCLPAGSEQSSLSNSVSGCCTKTRVTLRLGASCLGDLTLPLLNGAPEARAFGGLLALAPGDDLSFSCLERWVQCVLEGKLGKEAAVSLHLLHPDKG